ncbi:MAG: beta-lactamase hydrolase domain-containing protein [Planctomycetota bacterium]|jgi:uncharacterized protein (TIGR01244 family)
MRVFPPDLARPGVRRLALTAAATFTLAAAMSVPAAARQGIAGASARLGPPAGVGLRPCPGGDFKRLHVWGGILLGSQPSRSDLELAAEGGLRTVINQRRAEEMTELDEAAIVTELGLTYHHLGWNGPEQLTDEILDETLALLRTAERPILLHCSSSNRSGATWLAFSMLDRGLGWDEALAEAKAVGLRTPSYAPIVRDYVERRRADPAPSAGLSGATHEAVLAALDDEWRAQAFYRAVIAEHGSRRPFSRIVDAEGRHAAHLIALLREHGLDVPEDRWAGESFEVPDTFGETCRLAAELERENVALYDRLLEEVVEPEARQVLERLRDRSLRRHLPAFERHASHR